MKKRIERACTGFKIINPETAIATILVEDADLKVRVVDAGLASKYAMDNGTALSVSDLLTIPKFDDVFVVEPGEENQSVIEFVESLCGERDRVRRHAAEIKAKGRTSFQDMPYAFWKGEPILVTIQPGLFHGALVKSVTVRYGQFGPYLDVNFQFAHYDGTKFVFAESNRYIGEFEGEKTFSELRIEPMTDDAAELLRVRGDLYRNVNTDHLPRSYDGVLERTSVYETPRKFRVNGRVMIDIHSLKLLDPNYRAFYGDVRISPPPEADLNDPTVLACCSPYVYGYSYNSSNRQWGQMRLDAISDCKWSENAWDRLVLPEGQERRKELIRGLVESHNGESVGVIPGKGAGLILLMEGDPGLGKTLLAEVVAEETHRPLLVISSGDLGVDPASVEKKLREIFDMAVLWNAIVLIDECEIFVNQRTPNDIIRNAIVTVFLRMLEYFNGILFLTTNQSLHVDKAFISRIALRLSFKALTEEQRCKIWAGMTGGKLVGCLTALSRHQLNGREIEHAWLCACALARHEGRSVNLDDVLEMIKLGDEFRTSDPFELKEGGN